MNLDLVCKILSKDDGSLPEIEFDFGSEKISPIAYDLIQRRSTFLASKHAYYWSTLKNVEVQIKHGDNPAYLLNTGEAESFHVVFGGLKTKNGHAVPDIGLFVFSPTQVSLDYRMGKEWDQFAIEGLFEIMFSLESLAKETKIQHVGNIFDLDGVLMSTYANWCISQNAM